MPVTAPTIVSSSLSSSSPIVDTAATDTLIRASDSHRLLSDISTSNAPLRVGLPNQSSILSTASGRVAPIMESSSFQSSLDIPGHVFSDQQLSRSLFSVADYCNRGCTAVFTDSKFEIFSPVGEIILQGFKNPNDKLWPVQLNDAARNAHDNGSEASNVVRHELDAEFVAFCHAALGSPTLSTFLRALRAGWLSTWPRLTAKIVAANPPASKATALGHLDLNRQGQRSTRRSSNAACVEPLAAASISQHQHDYYIADEPDLDDFAVTKIVDFSDEVLHADMAGGQMPVTSQCGNNFNLVAVFANNISIIPMRNREAPSYVAAHRKIREYYRERGLTPKILRLDNETSSLLKDYMASEGVRMQYVPPSNHRANKAERAIRDVKNHFAATMATVNRNCPARIWDEFVPQIELTLNLLRPFAKDPTMSAYHGINGYKYNFDAHPIAPCGTAVVIYESPEHRRSWAAHGQSGFYVGPAVDHYRCFRVYSSTTNRVRVSDTLAWFPEPFKLPGSSSTELVLAAVNNLAEVLRAQQQAEQGVINQAQQQARAQLADKTVALLRQSLAMYMPPPGILSPAVSATPARAAVVPPPIQGVLTDLPPISAVSQSPPASAPPVQGVQSSALSTAAVPAQLSTVPVVVASSRSRRRRQAASPVAMPVRVVVPTVTTVSTRPFRERKLPKRIFEDYLAHMAYHMSRVETKAEASAQVFAAVRALNLDDQGRPLTYRKVMRGPDAEAWLEKTVEEYVRLLDETKSIKPILRKDQPFDRRKDTTYVKATVREKYNSDGTIKRRVRAVAGGDRINYPYEVSAKTAELVTFKVLIQAAVSERRKGGGKFCTMDIKDFYIQAPLLRPEYIRIHRSAIPEEVMVRFNLEAFVEDNSVLFEVNTCMYGLPQAGYLSQERLFKHLAENGFIQDDNIPCLFKHVERDLYFVLTVDDFGVKYAKQADAQFLLDVLRKQYEVSVDWSGSKYLGYTIAFDDLKHTATLSMPGYVDKMLQRFFPGQTFKGAGSPGVYVPPNYGVKLQVTRVDLSAPLDKDRSGVLQEIVGSLLFYARCVDVTILQDVNRLSSLQSHATEQVWEEMLRVISYLAAYPQHLLVYKACDMQLRSHSDASYHSRSEARSVAGGILFCADLNASDDYYNGALQTLSLIIPTVCSSAAEAEYAALFLVGREDMWLIANLTSFGYPQSSVPIYCDNECAKGIAERSVKVKRSKSIDMRYHWIREKVRDKVFAVVWKAGVDNLADCFTKCLPVHEFQRIKHRYVSFIPDPSNPALSRLARRKQSITVAMSQQQ